MNSHNGTPCILWPLVSEQGYGRTRVGGRKVMAHRFIYEIARGKVPPGLVLDHLCRNRSCVNPDHLEPVTHRENILRGVGQCAINAVKTHCKNGHELTPENTYRQARGRGCRKCKSDRSKKYRERAQQ